ARSCLAEQAHSQLVCQSFLRRAYRIWPLRAYGCPLTFTSKQVVGHRTIFGRKAIKLNRFGHHDVNFLSERFDRFRRCCYTQLLAAGDPDSGVSIPESYNREVHVSTFVAATVCCEYGVSCDRGQWQPGYFE